MNNMHPVMQQALAAFIPPAETKEMTEYRAALRRFDWQFEFSEDNSIVCEGRNELEKLHKMQKELDPNGSIWKAVATEGHGIPRPIVKEVNHE